MVKYFCIHTLALVKKCFEYIYTLDFINLKKYRDQFFLMVATLK